MARRYLSGTPIPLEKEVEVDGELVMQVVGDTRCVEAIGKSDGVKRIFLVQYDGVTQSAWRWSGDVETFDEATVSLDPNIETQWEIENG
jgi:hypothetical protein